MRSIFYVAVAVAIFARSCVVAASTNADESQLLSKVSPDVAADAMIRSDSQKRFLRVTDPEDDALIAANEERGKWAFLDDVIARANAAEKLQGLTKDSAKTILKAANRGDDTLTKEEKEIAAFLQKLADEKNKS
ncbi:hypothetical protein F444_22745 [Phytophthora nicotianae P1976]|uniref:RxLR effector protein n=1 Tax=Phytophthora nicotianae P1976 TaxID=1317066 RepID=A0A080YWW7_PHYNI|nr:hypothetical protein F444_22745 [Phytophthora nicotianae P1976]